MNLFTALLSFVMAAEAAKKVQLDSIPSNSKLGKKILSKSRKLDENEEEEEYDISWLTAYDLKFQGCYETSAWNADAGDDEGDVKVMTKRLVRYRLCPSGYCDSDSAGGCSSGYGDYLVDLNQFLDTWTEAKMEKEEYECEMAREACGCGENDADDDEDACEYNCYTNAGMSYCIQEEGAFELQRYTYCGEFEMEDQNDENRRKLDEEEEQIYLGPYCSGQGGAIYLGMFTDETCSVKYNSYYGKDYYYQLTGSSLPYSEANIVGLSCKSCIWENWNGDEERRRKLDQGEYQDANGNYLDAICAESYQGSAKCEENMNGLDNPNTYGCNFMEGIKVVRAAGTVTEVESTPSKAASAFIGIFAVSFIVLGAYVYYLKTKLDKAKINLDG